MPKDDPSGREAGKYSNVCGECAGFQYAPPVEFEGSKSDVQRCGLCKRAMWHKEPYERLRIMKGDDVPFEDGLHAMCHDCFEKYKPVVQARLGKPQAAGHALM